jgi:hypothetical protein
MKAGDISRSIFIVFIFILLYMFNILTVGLNRMKQNWPLYRCNPVVMPFAGMMGHDATQNFTYCIQNVQSNFMSYLLQPLHYNFNVVGNITGNISNAVNDVRKFFYKLRSLIGNIVTSVFGVFLNVIVEFQRVTINIRDIFGKLSGMLVVMIYTIGGSMMTAESWMDGIPGTMLKDAYNFACFAPDTLVRLQSGEVMPMCNVPLGSILTNGARVRAIMTISNIKDDCVGEPYYVISGGERGAPINVTGHHLVYNAEKGIYVHVKDMPGACVSEREPDKELSCLITSNHTIPIGARLFHDWEDNQP